MCRDPWTRLTGNDGMEAAERNDGATSGGMETPERKGRSGRDDAEATGRKQGDEGGVDDRFIAI